MMDQDLTDVTQDPEQALREQLRQAADRLTRARYIYDYGEKNLNLLRDSRENFINSLRNTGLSYIEAKTKYDNCLDDQTAHLKELGTELDYAQRLYTRACADMETAAAVVQ
ncbi:hypothetical protein ACILG0_21405 [Pseudomonadota bacterium AL_CKDN230030165-1A_HGKHYDSX7]